MFQQLFAIASNTLTESIRQPIYTVLILLGGLALTLNLRLAGYTFDDDNILMIQFGLSTILLVCLLLAGFTATSVLSEEIETRTVLTVVSKPVPRPLFVIGKFLGVAGAITVAFYILCLIFMIIVRHRVMSTARDHVDQPVLIFGLLAVFGAFVFATAANYFYRKVFTSTFVMTLCLTMSFAFVGVLLFDKDWSLQSPTTEFLLNDQLLIELIAGMVFVLMAVWILTAVALAASTRLGQVMTLMICLGVFLVGLISGTFDQIVETQLGVSTTLGPAQVFQVIWTSDANIGLKLVYSLLQTMYLLLPNLQYFWPADAISLGNSLIRNEDDQFSLAYLGSVFAYAFFYIVAVLAAAIALFQNREVG